MMIFRVVKCVLERAPASGYIPYQPRLAGEKTYSTWARWALRAIRKYVLEDIKYIPTHVRAIYHTPREAAVI